VYGPSFLFLLFQVITVTVHQKWILNILKDIKDMYFDVLNISNFNIPGIPVLPYLVTSLNS
jgi:hypothetical protein